MVGKMVSLLLLRSVVMEGKMVFGSPWLFVDFQTEITHLINTVCRVFQTKHVKMPRIVVA